MSLHLALLYGGGPCLSHRCALLLKCIEYFFMTKTSGVSPSNWFDVEGYPPTIFCIKAGNFAFVSGAASHHPSQ